MFEASKFKDFNSQSQEELTYQYQATRKKQLSL